MGKDWYTVRELAELYAKGNYHEIYHYIRKGALEAQRPKHYQVRVSSTSARVLWPDERDE